MTKLLQACASLIGRLIHPVPDPIISVGHLHSLCVIEFPLRSKEKVEATAPGEVRACRRNVSQRSISAAA